MDQSTSTSQGFEYLSKSELIQKLSQIKESHIPSSQTIYLIKQLLSSVSEPEYVIEEIPNILVCSSSEFLDLLPSFKLLITEKPLCVSKLLQILNSFDYNSESKKLAHELALEIFEKIGIEQIPDLIPFLLFTASKHSIPSLFSQMKEILTVHENPLIYKSLEAGVRPHLPSFFHCISLGDSEDQKWAFFDFFILLISQSRPSLRNQIPTLIWNSIISKKLTFQMLVEFCQRTEILNSHFNLLSSLYNIIVNSVPKCYEITSIGHLSMFAIQIVNCYPDFSSEFVDDLMSYVINGNNFLAEIASHCLLSISPTYYINHITELDDCLSQRSGFMTNTALQTLCELISMNGRVQSKSKTTGSLSETSIQEFQQNQSILMISLQKKLFSTSNVLIEAGVNLALHFTTFLNFDEILEWVLKAIRADRLVESSLRPSILLSVVDLIWSKLNESSEDDHLIREIMNFCNDVLFTFNIIVDLNGKESCIGSERNQFSISSENIPTELHATLCGEVICIVSNIINRYGQLNDDDAEDEDESNKSQKIDPQKLDFLKDISSVCFIVPTVFITLVSNPESKGKLKPIHITNLVNIRSMIIPIMYRLKSSEISTILFFMDIVNTIDDFFSTDNVKRMRFVPESFEQTIFPAQFAFSILSECFFDFPTDLNFVYLLIKSLYSIFVSTINSRFPICDKIDFLKKKMPETFPIRIMTLVESIVNLSVVWRKENKINYVKRCIRAAVFGLDFVSFCISCGIDTKLDFKNNIIDLLEIDEDAGIACRVILIGSFLGIEKHDLAQLAAQTFIGWRIKCDLSDTSFLYPFGFDHLSESVKPFNDGESWRLLVFLSLQFSDFDSFYKQFNVLLDKINDESIEIQMCFSLIDILIYRLNEFVENFPEICEICYRLIKLLVHCDLVVLRLVSKLIHELNGLKKKFIQLLLLKDEEEEFFENKEDVQKRLKSQKIIHQINDFLKSQFNQFKGIQSKPFLKASIAQIQGECELLAEDEIKNQSESENENSEEVVSAQLETNANPFRIESSSDKEFTETNDDDIEEEEEDLSSF